MANDLNLEPISKKQPFPSEKEAKTKMAVNCEKGEILFDKITGEQYRITKKNNVNGIDHFRLASESGETMVFLSKFAIDERFTTQKKEGQSFGQRMVVRLSEMF